MYDLLPTCCIQGYTDVSIKALRIIRSLTSNFHSLLKVLSESTHISNKATYFRKREC